MTRPIVTVKSCAARRVGTGKSILCMLYVAGTRSVAPLEMVTGNHCRVSLYRSSRGFKVSSRSEFYANAPLASNFLIRCTHLDQFNSLTD